MLALVKRSCDKHRQHVKRQRHYFANKSPSSQSYGFSRNHVWMWVLDHKEGWAQKNWCFWIVLEKTLESPLNRKETKPVNPKGNQCWLFMEGLVVKLQYFGHLMQRTDSFEKTLMLGKIEAIQEEKGMTEDEMVGWHHWLSGHEFEQAPGVGKGQGSLECYSPWGHKESDTTERLNNSNHPNDRKRI